MDVVPGNLEFNQYAGSKTIVVTTDAISGWNITGENDWIKVTSRHKFNEAMLSDQWHYYNDGSLNGSIAGCNINVFNVWRDYIAGSSAVIVCAPELHIK